MKNFHFKRAASSLSSALLIILYFALIACDIFTTWLGSPDLKMERNIIIRYFGLNWTQIIILATLAATLISLGLLKSINVIGNYRNCNPGDFSPKLVLSDRKLTFSFIGIWIFTSHFFASVYLTVNNYFGYLIVSGLKNSFSDYAVAYYLFRQKFEPHFYEYTLGIIVLIAFYITWMTINVLNVKRLSPANLN